ncbi:MAG: hypothetical protein IH936_15380 [Acidobacteria bacterium]|nr:hypothetical protein [Acidobacteriota bacterium]
MKTTTTLAAMLLTTILVAPLAKAETDVDVDPMASAGHWRGIDGQALPFATHGQVLEFLRTAEVVDSVEIKGSLNRPLKLTLEKDGVRAHAIFRTVNVERDEMRHVREHARGFRDSYVFEVAAYELSRLLDLDNVPPAVLRKIGREKGSVQLWVEQAMGVQERMEQGIDPRHEKLWLFQKQNMVVFDNLIYNFDRNPGNILIDASGKVWFVDHTRSFKKLPVLSNRAQMKVLERRFWNRLCDLDAEAVREQLDPYLDGRQIEALLARQRKIVKTIKRRIAEYGEQAILFEFVSTPA